MIHNSQRANLAGSLVFLSIAFAMQYLQSSLYPIAAAITENSGLEMRVLGWTLAISSGAGLCTIILVGQIRRKLDLFRILHYSMILAFLGLVVFNVIVIAGPMPSALRVFASLMSRGLMCGIGIALAGLLVHEGLLILGLQQVGPSNRAMFALTSTQGLAVVVASAAATIFVSLDVIGPLLVGVALIAIVQIMLKIFLHWYRPLISFKQSASQAGLQRKISWWDVQHIILGLLILIPMPYLQTIWSYVLSEKFSGALESVRASGVTLAIAGIGTISAGLITKRIHLNSTKKLMAFGSVCVALGWSFAALTSSIEVLLLAAFVVGVGFGCSLAGFLAGPADLQQKREMSQIAQLSQLTLYISSMIGPVLATTLQTQFSTISLWVPVMLVAVGGAMAVLVRREGVYRYSARWQ